LEQFRNETTSLSTELVAKVETAWAAHVKENISKGLPDNEKIQEGEEEKAWAWISAEIQKPEWKQACLRREEKFDMYVSSAVRYNYSSS